MNKKNIFAIVLCFCFVMQMLSQEKQVISTTEKYKQFGLVWGLMKYHHFEVSNGKYNWDEIFVENFDKLESVITQTNLDAFLLNFILSIPESKIKTDTNTDNLFIKNVDYNWIEQYSANKELYTKLKKLENNTSIGNYYTSKGGIPTFENEKGFKAFDYKIKSHRLLELFSFWNVIQYHYVNKYLMDKNWYSQLENFVGNFANANSQLDFELAKTHLIVSLNDSHSYYFSKTVLDSLFKFKPPIATMNINDTLVVTGTFNKLVEKDDLKLGDLIVEINDIDIKSFRKQKTGSMISSSNENHLRYWTRLLMFNKEDSLKVKIKRKDFVTTKYIHLYKTFSKDEDYSDLPFFSYKKEWQIIDDNIGYINLSKITKEDTKKAFEAFSNTNGIIIDLRNYPKNISGSDIAEYTYPDRKEFIKVLSPLRNRPSLSNFGKPSISIIMDPFKAGSKNSKYYNKKIILLVNTATQSKAEYIGMAIQASPACITVGETTSGAPMNIAVFKLPDETEFQFTAMGGFYPDGTSVQGKGLKIDHYVKETTSNFTADQYIMKGIELIKAAENQAN
ncbi:C-terminal processing protease CtpA/Prc [Flavobacterium sp. 2755]|uniref:S41 family peptidase n=1 Tax=Flavobacterium sp. 2755 TaxID=2817765 RepID=UPI0028628883|nr:S41 family peptidase [Flavobacterium sp. 2755]MDR6761947.1 C-terminal processing protease CtpA/Prc [Flavobacterium sp. 2755]